MNRLVIVGGMGNRRVYLNVSRDEAVERYAKRFPFDDFGLDHVSEFEFEQEFEAYDVWPIGGWRLEEEKGNHEVEKDATFRP